MTLCLPPSPSWYCTQIVDCHKDRAILAYGCRNDVVLIKLLNVTDGSVSLGPPRNIWVHHNIRITAVRFCPFAGHDTLLASAGDDQMVNVLDSETEAVVYRHTVHAGAVSCLAWVRLNDHAVFVVSGDDAGMIVVANVASRKTRCHSPVNKAVTSMAACPHSPGLVVVGYRDGAVVVLDLHSADRNLVLLKKKMHGQDVQSVCWAPFRGAGPLKTITGGHPTELLVATGSRDGTIRIWNAGTGEVAVTFTIPLNVGSRSKRAFDDKRSKLVNALYWPAHVPDVLMSSSHAGSFLRWNLLHDQESAGGKIVHESEDVKAANETGSSKTAHQTGSGAKAVPWSIVGQKQVGGKQHFSSLFSIAGFGDHGAVTVSIDRHIMFWNISTAAIERSWLLSVTTIGGYVYQLHFSPFNSGMLALGCGDSTIKTWNLTTASDPYDVATMWQGIRGHVMSISWHPGKESLLAFGTKDGRVGLYDVLANKLLAEGPHSRELKRQASVYVVCWGPSITSDTETSSMEIYSCGGGIVSVHDPRQLDKPATDIDRILRPDVFNKPGSSRYSDVTWNAIGTVLALGDDQGIVRLFVQPGLQPLATVESCGKQIRGMTWHPEYTLSSTEPSRYRNWLAFATKGTTFYVHNFDSVFDSPPKLAAAPVRCDLELSGHTDEVPQLCWNPHLDGQLASSSYDGMVKVWDAPAGQVLACYCGHMAKVFTCAWSPLDPDVVFSGGTDFSVHMWRVSEQQTEPLADWLKRRSEQRERMVGSAKRPPLSLANRPTIVSKEVPVMTTTPDIAEMIEQRKREILARGDTVVTMLKSSAASATTTTADRPIDRDLGVENGMIGAADKLDVVVKNSISGSCKNKKNKKSVLAKSIFPVTNQLDNSCGKAANLEDCILLAGRSISCGSSNDKVDFGSGAHTHLGIYGQRVDAYRLLKTEAEKHAAGDNLDYALQLEIWKGNVTGALKLAMENEQLSDWLVAMAATASQSRYVEVCEFYAKQLVRSGNPRKGVLYLLAIDKVHEAIDVLKQHVSYMEAVILAKVRLSQKDPLIAQLLEERAEQLAEKGQVEVAAKCYLGSGNPTKAAALLCHKQDANGLRVSAVIARKCGDIQKASEYAAQALVESAVTPDFETAATVIKENPDLMHCSLVFSVLRHLIGLWRPSKPIEGEKSLKIESNEATKVDFFTTICNIWDSEGALKISENSRDVLMEHSSVIQRIFLPMKPRGETQVLAYLSTCVSMSILHDATGDCLKALEKILDCYVAIQHLAITGMMPWWTNVIQHGRNLKGQLFLAVDSDGGSSVQRSLQAYLALSHLQRLRDEVDAPATGNHASLHSSISNLAEEDSANTIPDSGSCPNCVRSASMAESLSKKLLDDSRGELSALTGRLSLVKVALAGALARRKSGILMAAAKNGSIPAKKAFSDVEDDGASADPIVATETVGDGVEEQSSLVTALESLDVTDSALEVIDVSTILTHKLMERAAEVPVEGWQMELVRIEDKIKTMEKNKDCDFPDVLVAARLLIELCNAIRQACVNDSMGCEALLSVMSVAAEFGLRHSVYQNDVNLFGVHCRMTPAASSVPASSFD